MATVKTDLFDKKIRPFLETIAAWKRNGITDTKIGTYLDVSATTLLRYKALGDPDNKLYDKKYREFFDVMTLNREIADGSVENALFKSSQGHIVALKKPVKLKEIIYNDDGKKIGEKEFLVDAITEEYIPPQVPAQVFWLKNRKKEEWREKQEQLDADGQAIQNVKDILISVRETVQLKGGIIKDDDGTDDDK